MYDVLLPSFIAGFAAFTTARFLGIDYTYYDLHFFQDVSLDITLISKVVLAGLFFGFVSDFIITTVSKMEKYINLIKISIYIKAFVGGSIIVAMTLVFGEQYIGLGLDTIAQTLNPTIPLIEDVH